MSSTGVVQRPTFIEHKTKEALCYYDNRLAIHCNTHEQTFTAHASKECSAMVILSLSCLRE